jgi:hypothetical protein
MTSFTPDELARIDGAEELLIAGRRADGTLRKSVIIWMVAHDGALYVRSVNGVDAAWFRGTQDQHSGHISAGGVEKDVSFITDSTVDDVLDAAYRAKYSYPSAVTAINAPAARATTLRVEPA